MGYMYVSDGDGVESFKSSIVLDFASGCMEYREL